MSNYFRLEDSTNSHFILQCFGRMWAGEKRFFFRNEIEKLSFLLPVTVFSYVSEYLPYEGGSRKRRKEWQWPSRSLELEGKSKTTAWFSSNSVAWENILPAGRYENQLKPQDHEVENQSPPFNVKGSWWQVAEGLKNVKGRQTLGSQKLLNKAMKLKLSVSPRLKII